MLRCCLFSLVRPCCYPLFVGLFVFLSGFGYFGPQVHWPLRLPFPETSSMTHQAQGCEQHTLLELQSAPILRWIGPIGPPRNMGQQTYIFHFSGPWKNSLNGTNWSWEVIFPANPDLADILGDMNFDFDNFHVFDVVGYQISTFEGSQIMDFQQSGIPCFPKSEFPDFQNSLSQH